MEYQPIQPFLETAAVLLGLYLAFFKSYFKEKGKNLATEQDIKKITVLVEEAKEEFTTNNELLKNKLTLYSQSFNSIKTLERNALIELNTKYAEWIHTLKTFSLVYYNYENYKILYEQDFVFSKKQFEFEVAQENLHLFMHDQELRQNKTELSTLTFQLQMKILQKVTLFISNCKTYNIQRQGITPEKELELNSDYHSKQLPLVNDSIEEFSDLYKQILVHQVNLIKLINKRIYQLIENE